MHIITNQQQILIYLLPQQLASDFQRNCLTFRLTSEKLLVIELLKDEDKKNTKPRF